MTTPSQQLHAWRSAQPRTLRSIVDAAGVSHPTWLGWEAGDRTPTLAGALRVEVLTGGAVPVESWGYTLDDARAVISMRKRAARAA